MNSLTIARGFQILVRKKRQSARIAAMLYGTYTSPGGTRVISGHHHREIDHYMGWFRSDKISPDQFALIARTISEAVTNNISSQIVRDNNPDAICSARIEIKPAGEYKDHLIDVTLMVDFESKLLDGENNPQKLRLEFGRQVAEIFIRAREGRLEFDEPAPHFQALRVGVARLAQKLVK